MTKTVPSKGARNNPTTPRIIIIDSIAEQKHIAGNGFTRPVTYV
jgi:hypothetical protein